MQWSAERNGGFSLARRLVHPVISEGPYGCRTINVEAQRRDPGSLLNWMVSMVRLRKECPEIGWGRYSVLRTGSSAVLGLCYEWRGNRVVVLHNFSREPQRIRVRLSGDGAGVLENLRKDETSAAEDGAHRITLESYGYRWYRVGGLNYAIRREHEGPGAGR